MLMILGRNLLVGVMIMTFVDNQSDNDNEDDDENEIHF